MEPLIYAYADESCLGNQNVGRDSPGGAAVLLEYWRGDRWHRGDAWVSEPGTTNNRMALRSAILAFASLKKPSRVIFTSDSNYLVKGASEWVWGWVRRGWKRKTGPVENETLWKAMLRAAEPHQVEWRWVRGHAGHPQNEYANDCAVAAAKKQQNTKGLQPSGFEKWLEQQREKKERYFDFMEHAAPPADEVFKPVKMPGG